MKKILFFITVLSALQFSTSAQSKRVQAVKAKPFNLNRVEYGTSPGISACDTINLDVANSKWNAFFYPYGTDGYLFGTSDNAVYGFNVVEDANYFDLSAYNYAYVSGGLAYFAFANSNVAADLNKNIVFKIYDDSAGSPDHLLDSASVPLSKIHQDVLNNYLTEFAFSSAVAIPASKKFYISIDHSNFVWSDTTKDSIAIVADGSNDTTAAAFQKIYVAGQGESWFPVNETWQDTAANPLNINLFIFPYVSNSASGCAVLPVSMFNFGGQIKDNDAYLNWSTASEINNKGFSVERSKDGQNFGSIGFVKGAGNSNKVTNYTYTDATLKDIDVTTTYYRLKQVDVDGKFTYSKVLALNLNSVAGWKFYPNPVKNVATVELNLNTASKVNVQVISRDGKVVLNADKGVLTSGKQQVFVNTQNLSSGTYIVRVMAGNKTYTQLFIKE